MIVVALGAAAIAFLLYGAFLLHRLRSEDASTWPIVELPGSRARLRLHPAWRPRPGVAADGSLTVLTSARDSRLRIVPLEDGGLAEALARAIASRSVHLDEAASEPVSAGQCLGLRAASAGTLAGGERRYFEFTVLAGPDGRSLLFEYDCPVLLGSVDSPALARALGSLSVGLPGAPDGSDRGPEGAPVRPRRASEADETARSGGQ